MFFSPTSYNLLVLELNLKFQMTCLDNGIRKFPNLVSLNLCGNYIAALETYFLPTDLRILELQANRISNLKCFYNLPQNLSYLGLARNLLANGKTI